MTTKASWGFSGMARKKALRGSRPPADAPIATTLGRRAGERAGESDSFT
jgi:hypothetical protein